MSRKVLPELADNILEESVITSGSKRDPSDLPCFGDDHQHLEQSLDA
jgi:hypothetical protein